MPAAPLHDWTLRFVEPATAEMTCAPVRCATTCFDCHIPCATAETERDCAAAIERITRLLQRCVGASSGGRILLRRHAAGVLVIESPGKFDLCVESDEFALPPEEGLILSATCPINNLCNGIEGDERGEWRSGYRLELFERDCDDALIATPAGLLRLIQQHGAQYISPLVLFHYARHWKPQP